MIGSINELSNAFIATPIARALDDPSNVLSKGDILTTWNASVADIYANFSQNPDLYKYSVNSNELAQTIKIAGDRLSGQIDFLTGSTAKTYEAKVAAMAGYKKAEQYLGDIAFFEAWEASDDPFLNQQAQMVREHRTGYFKAMGEMVTALEKHNDPKAVKAMITKTFDSKFRAFGEVLLQTIEAGYSDKTKLWTDPRLMERNLDELLTSLLGAGSPTFARRLEKHTRLYIDWLNGHPQGGGAYKNLAESLNNKLVRYLDNMKIGAKLK